MTILRCSFGVPMRQPQDWEQREQEWEHVEMDWPYWQGWDDWVELELHKIQVWARPAQPQALSVESSCGCAVLSIQCCTWTKTKEMMGKQSLSPLFREEIYCFWGQERLLHQLHKALKKQVPEAQALAAEHNTVSGADLSAVGMWKE